ncbi:MAG: helix-turn-helix transcriptional regulator [Methylobacteriaceae bacterium]|nr:helix-turn-helix transcriptional regulator [Methylobacteriaceae bacterium]
MDDRQLTRALASLGQPTRFAIFRCLVAEGWARGGMHAGEVARATGRSHGMTAVHLKELERAGLVLSANNGHATFFQPDVPALADLAASLGAALGLGLAEDCAPPADTAVAGSPRQGAGAPA